MIFPSTLRRLIIADNGVTPEYFQAGDSLLKPIASKLDIKFSEGSNAIDFAVADYGKIPSMMDKSDRLAILQKLDKEGVFMIKGSVEYISRVLGSSRYTIYNYLKQIRSWDALV